MTEELIRKPHSLGEAMERLTHRWPVVAGVGALTVLLGLAALVLTVSATIATIFVIGALMAIAGGMEIIVGFNAKTWGRFFLWIASGLIYVVAGAVAFAQPILAAAFFTIALGIGFLAAGAVRLWIASHMPPGSRGAPTFSALVTLCLGAVIVLGWPGNSVVALGLLVGIDLIFYGANWIALAFALRRMHGR